MSSKLYILLINHIIYDNFFDLIITNIIVNNTFFRDIRLLYNSSLAFGKKMNFENYTISL